ncbi:hypothetical protein SeMB42_g02932 [Synchytrium endobioticum]|uniref:TNase-like domain-containing protein n=1 Tax=Synchytrium endobioticum TaxID=286115 RepID=A0A507DCK9_9FUNG|nr:hypothetical protein SeLEV6574_g04527 [Synchytrium endobioticum]TPX48610.1 hypothetical protein SeMB42_g02932 [Synchytrium endobioticum]
MSSSPHNNKPTGLHTALSNCKATILSVWSTIPTPAQYALLASSALLLLYRLRQMPKRIQNSAFFTPDTFKQHPKLKGVVTSVGDADGFRIYHTPWLFSTFKPGKKVSADQTIHIRLAGVDAPELAHFGSKSQPFGPEALAHLKKLILHKKVIIRPYRKDQYGRIVASCSVPYFGGLLSKDVGSDMLKHGLAVVYTQGGAVYGGREQEYTATEARAKARKIGVWSQRNFRTPAEHKAKAKMNNM